MLANIIAKQAMPFGDHLLLNVDWRFGDLLLLKQNRKSLVAFTGLEGVNNVSHMFLLF